MIRVLKNDIQRIYDYMQSTSMNTKAYLPYSDNTLWRYINNTLIVIVGFNNFGWFSRETHKIDVKNKNCRIKPRKPHAWVNTDAPCTEDCIRLK